MRSSRFFFSGSLLIIILFVMSVSANAGLMDGFSGWTEFSECAHCDTIVNFSVYQSDDDNWTDDMFFTNAGNMENQYGSFDSSAQYVYMYQVVNVDPDTSAEENVSKFAVETVGSAVTSGGYFDGTVFNDSTAQIDGNNWSLSDPDPSFPGDDPIDPVTGLGDGQPSETVNEANVSLVADSTGNIRNPYSLQTANGGCPGPDSPCDVMVWNFTYPGEIGEESDEYSSVLFLTSDAAPRYHFGETESIQGTGADGEIPSVVPEPISSALFLVGGATLGFRRFRKK